MQVVADTRPCPKCYKDVSVHASLCGHCWADISEMEDPREKWTRSSKASRHRTLTAVVLVSAVVLTLFFLGMQRFLTKNVAAETALVGAKPAVTARAARPVTPETGAPALSVDDHGVTVEASTEAAPPPTPPTAKRQRPALDPADPMYVEQDETQLSTSSAQLQTVYIAIVCSCLALVAALVAFASAWR